MHVSNFACMRECFHKHACRKTCKNANTLACNMKASKHENILACANEKTCKHANTLACKNEKHVNMQTHELAQMKKM
jgi:hypothetical protein